MPAIDIRQVSKRFGTFTAVDNLSLSVPAGCVQGFLGPNGAGKTTTLRMVMNIFAPDTGTIDVLGARMSEPLKKRIGYLPEERGLYTQDFREGILGGWAKVYVDALIAYKKTENRKELGSFYGTNIRVYRWKITMWTDKKFFERDEIQNWSD